MTVVRPIPELDALRGLLNPPPSPTRVYFNGGPGTPDATEGTEDSGPALEFTARGRVEVITLEAAGVYLDLKDDPESILNEVERTTETVRVSNPEDPEQYVDNEVATTVTVKNKRGAPRQYFFTV